MQEQIVPRPEKDWLKIADELEALQTKENDGRGISCVRGVITYLRLGKIEDAIRAGEWDHDKIRNYPAVQKFMFDHDLMPEIKALYERMDRRK